MLLFNRDFFIASTPFHLLLMCALLFYTQQKIDRSFIILFISCFVVGIVVEIIGTSTGLLFGNYQYGAALGTAIKNVPLVIGINWFIIIYCCGVSIQMLFNRLAKKVGEENINQSPIVKALSVIIDGATLAVIFDFLLEPAAIKLGYWQWLGDGDVPWFNYICWFLVSAGLLTIFQFSTFNKHNKFAVNLLLIQALFFLLVRTFL